jgi:hypothetical protein
MYKAFVQEFSYRFPKYIEFLRRFEHGGYVISKQEQKVRKETLLKGGIADYGLFVQSGCYTMLWIEFKVKGNTLSRLQKETACMMTLWGAKCVACWSAEEGIEEVTTYFSDLFS